MLEEMLDIRKVQRAFSWVTAHNVAGGIGGKQTNKLRHYLNANWHTLRADILTGHYRPLEER